MKKTIFIFLLAFTYCLSSQNTAKDLFKTNRITWFGLNFSEARMIGAFDQAMGAGMANANELRNKWIPSWNMLVVSEPQNFNLKEAFRKSDIYYDLDATDKMNHEIDLDNLMTYNSFKFSEPAETVQNIVSKLESKEVKEGIGVVFVVEYFNKNADEASVYVTIFDIKTKKVLITERIIEKPVGFGLRNYWAGSIKNILKQITRVNYNYWKAKEN